MLLRYNYKLQGHLTDKIPSCQSSQRYFIDINISTLLNSSLPQSTMVQVKLMELINKKVLFGHILDECCVLRMLSRSS